MAKIINVSVLQINQNSLPQAQLTAIPVGSLNVSPVDIVVNGVQANSLIILPSNGLNQVSESLLVEETVNEIATLANAGNSPTTTTTTAAPAPTRYLRLNGDFAESIIACTSWGGGTYSNVYAAESNINSVTHLYTDSGLTTPVSNSAGNYISIAVPSGPSYTNTHTLIVGNAGLVSALTAC